MKKYKLINKITIITILLTLVMSTGIVTFAEKDDYPIVKMYVEKGSKHIWKQ